MAKAVGNACPRRRDAQPVQPQRTETDAERVVRNDLRMRNHGLDADEPTRREHQQDRPRPQASREREREEDRRARGDHEQVAQKGERDDHPLIGHRKHGVHQVRRHGSAHPDPQAQRETVPDRERHEQGSRSPQHRPWPAPFREHARHQKSRQRRQQHDAGAAQDIAQHRDQRRSGLGEMGSQRRVHVRHRHDAQHPRGPDGVRAVTDPDPQRVIGARGHHRDQRTSPARGYSRVRYG